MIRCLGFFKCDYWIGKSGLPWLGNSQRKISECTVADNVIIHCNIIYYSRWTYNNQCNQRIIAKTIFSRTGDVEYITLLLQEN
jgi:hypothetical protein